MSNKEEFATRDRNKILNNLFTEEEKKEILDRALKTTAKEDFTQTEGVLRNRNIEITYSLHPYDSSDLDPNLKTVNITFDSLGNGWEGDFNWFAKKQGIKTPLDFYTLDNYIIKFGSIEIDVYNFLPKGYKVVFTPELKGTHASVLMDYGVVVINDNLSSLGSVLNTLHELGHLQFDKDSYIGEDPDYLKYIVEERHASHWTLKKIWSELKKNPEEKDLAIRFLRLNFEAYVVGYKNILEARNQTYP